MPEQSKNPFKFWQELKRRKVFRVIVMYAGAAYIIIELVNNVTEPLHLPEWTATLVILLLIIGFPIIAILSWIFDFTPEGLKKTDPVKVASETNVKKGKRRLKTSDGIIAVLIVVVCILLYPKIFNQDKPEKIKDSEEESINLIAVLPFSNIKSDPETDYLGFALADQIIGNLVYLHSITVRPSGSIRKYENQAVDPLIAGDELQVNYVLIGNYLKEANVMRLNVELINVDSNKIIWREPIQVDFQSAFELQDIVSQKVIEGMNVQFSEKERNRMRKDIPDNPLAYEYYLRSISYPYTNEGDRLAIEMLDKSIELDSTFAPAHNQLGLRIHNLAQYGLLNPEESKRAEDAILKALSLNKELISTLGNLAIYFTETGRIEEAMELTNQMFEINPNNDNTHFALGYIYRFAGMNNYAIKEMERAIAINPNHQGFRSICTSYMYAREFDKAFEVLKNYKPSPWVHRQAGFILLRQGKHEQAVNYFNQVIAMEPDGLPALFASAAKAYIENNIEAGINISRTFEQYNIEDAEAWYFNACNYGLLGDREGCIRCLHRAVDGGFFNYPAMLNDVCLDSMRDDLEFQKILEKAKEKHLAFKKKFF